VPGGLQAAPRRACFETPQESGIAARTARASTGPSSRLCVPCGGLVLKVNSVDTMLPIAMRDIHALLVQLGHEGDTTTPLC
jgi:hypothetical protein